MITSKKHTEIEFSYEQLRLVKFGGSSIATPNRLRNVLKLISTKQPVLIILSALFGTTDKLVELVNFIKNGEQNAFVGVILDLKVEYKKFVSELYVTAHYRDIATALIHQTFNQLEDYAERKYKIKIEKNILAVGERLSTQILNLLLQEEGLRTTLLNATDFVFIKKSGLPDYDRIEMNLKAILNKSKAAQIYITQGFLCTNALGELDNLQRGGSDYTATILASVLKVKEVEIWTDIDGVHNNDPRYVEQTAPLNYLSYDEASYLAFFGAKILHPLCIAPAKKANIPIRLKNTLKPENVGTLIHDQVIGEGIKAVSAKDNIQIIKVSSKRERASHDFYNEVFKVLNKHKVSSDLITTSEESVSLAIEESEILHKLSEALKPLGVVEIEDGLSAICIAGEFLKDSKGIGKEIFESLLEIPLRMISYGGNRHHLALLIQSQHKQKALLSLNNHLFKIAGEI